MTYDQPDNHAAFRAAIAVALTGGLSDAERAAFDAHRAACPDCAAEYDRSRESEARMTALFAAAVPTAGFEDRLIDRLRTTSASRGLRFRLPRPIRLHPAVQKSAAAVAATIVLAGVGYAVNGVLHDELPSHPARAFRSGLRDTSVRGPSMYWDFDGDQNGSVNRGRRESGTQSGEQHDSTRSWHDDFNQRFTQLGSGFVANNGNLTLNSSGVEPGMAIAGVPASGTRAPEVTNLYTYGVNPTFGDGKDKSAEVKDNLADGVAILGKPVTVIRGGSVVDAEGRAAESTDSKWFKPTQLALDQDQKKIEQLGEEVLRQRVADQPAPVTPPMLVEQQTTAAGVPGAVAVAGTVVEAAPNAEPPAPPTTQAAAQRKVIRNGQFAFEVDRFDSAFAQVSKLVSEAGGYVGTTTSRKLPNGKVQGTVTVRVPPDRMDTLVLQLRGIGDLKSQSLEAEDVSKKYTDLESQLRAARAMEERLIAIIKEGKGQIKDLLAAEKELGVWRTKVEQLTGEMKYYDNLVAMATLNLTLTERDIETPATAYESENVDAGIESEDVEAARAAALKTIEEAKGRVVQSDLKRFDAGQFGATIVAEVPPDTAGPLLDRLKQIGKVARLDVQRKQTADENKSNTATRSPVRVEKRDTRFNLSIYNLANVAPRQTVTLALAADDVEAAYAKVLDRIAKAGGRIVSSNLNRQKPEQTTGTIAFEVPSAQADAVTNDLRAGGEAMRLTVTENPDVQNVTTAKRGFNLSIISTASVAPREVATIQIAAADVAQAREKILQAASSTGAGGGARVLASQLNENDRQNVSATLELDVRRGEALNAIEKAIAGAGQTIKRNAQRSPDTENTIDSKVRLSLSLTPADKLPPRETTTLSIERSDVESAMASLQSAALESGGRIAQSNLMKDRDGRGIGKVTVDVPLDKASSLIAAARNRGELRSIDASKDLQVPPGQFARARIDVTFVTADTLVAPERGLLASIRSGLSTSLSALTWSLQLIVFGLFFVLPWAAVLYAIWRLIKRRRKVTPAPVPTT